MQDHFSVLKILWACNRFAGVPDTSLIPLTKRPETIRYALAPTLAELVVNLGTYDHLELSRNPEFMPQADNIWIETSFPSGWSNIGKRCGIFLRETLVEVFFIDEKGYLVRGSPFDLTSEINAGLEGSVKEDYTRIISGTIRFMNVIEPRFLEKQTCRERPPGRRFTGAPFSKVDMNFISLRGHVTDKGEHSAVDNYGVRFHFVRGHYMAVPGRVEKTWRRSHWRGDPALGTTRVLYDHNT